jgi:hypothetical protein
MFSAGTLLSMFNEGPNSAPVLASFHVYQTLPSTHGDRLRRPELSSLLLAGSVFSREHQQAAGWRPTSPHITEQPLGIVVILAGEGGVASEHAWRRLEQ